jgi:hypothetical protein
MDMGPGHPAAHRLGATTAIPSGKDTESGIAVVRRGGGAARGASCSAQFGPRGAHDLYRLPADALDCPVAQVSPGDVIPAAVTLPALAIENYLQ